MRTSLLLALLLAVPAARADWPILVHPGLFRPERPIVVAVNGKVVHEARVEPDVRFLLEGYLEDRDVRRLFVAEVRVDLR